MKALCYYYFPPCGNETHFEPPSSLCMSVCEYLTNDLCMKEWADALRHFNNVKSFLESFQIDVLNCSKPGGPLEPATQCCSNAGVEVYIGTHNNYYDYLIKKVLYCPENNPPQFSVLDMAQTGEGTYFQICSSYCLLTLTTT